MKILAVLIGLCLVFLFVWERVDIGEQPIHSAIDWFPTGATWFRIGVWVDPLTVVTLFFVGWTCLDDLHIQRWVP